MSLIQTWVWEYLILGHLERRLPDLNPVVGDPLKEVRRILEAQFPFHKEKEWAKPEPPWGNPNPYHHSLALWRLIEDEIKPPHPNEQRLSCLLDHLCATTYGFERRDMGVSHLSEQLSYMYWDMAPRTKISVVRALYTMGQPESFGFWLKTRLDPDNPLSMLSVAAIVDQHYPEERFDPLLKKMIAEGVNDPRIRPEKRRAHFGELFRVLLRKDRLDLLVPA